MTNQLTIYQGDTFDTMQRVAKALADSKFFEADFAKAITKVMAGQELGLPPFASMSGIHIIQGKPVMGANLIATLIDTHPLYEYRVTTMTDELVSIDFYKRGDKIGTSSFSMADARKAQTKNLDKFPRNMLFARAISNGARWYCPAIFGGSPVYTPDEMGLSVNEDGYIDGEIVETEPPDRVTDSTLKNLHTVGSSLYGKGWDSKRPELVTAKTKGRTASSKELTEEEALALVKGIANKLEAAQKDGQAPTPPPAPEQRTAGDVDGVAGETTRNHYAQLVANTAPKVGDVVAALVGDMVTSPQIALGIIQDGYLDLSPISPATKVANGMAIEMYNKVVSHLSKTVA